MNPWEAVSPSITTRRCSTGELSVPGTCILPSITEVWDRAAGNLFRKATESFVPGLAFPPMRLQPCSTKHQPVPSPRSATRSHYSNPSTHGSSGATMMRCLDLTEAFEPPRFNLVRQESHTTTSTVECLDLTFLLVTRARNISFSTILSDFPSSFSFHDLWQ